MSFNIAIVGLAPKTLKKSENFLVGGCNQSCLGFFATRVPAKLIIITRYNLISYVQYVNTLTYTQTSHRKHRRITLLDFSLKSVGGSISC